MTEKSIDILLAEDEPATANLTIEALRDARVSYHVFVARDGEEVLHFLHGDPPFANAPRPDLILLDFNLPKMDGREVLAKIKADPSLADIPVVVLTSSSNPHDVSDAYRLHVACYITKPAGLDQYFSAIRSLKELWLKHVTFPEKIRRIPLDN